MKEIKAIVQLFKLEEVLRALDALPNLPGVTVSHVLGRGKSRAASAESTVSEAGHRFVKKSKLEIVVPDDLAAVVVDTIATAARTGNVGDGKIFVYEVAEVVKIRTGQRGAAAI